jgi:hypothetical protein
MNLARKLTTIAVVMIIIFMAILSEMYCILKNESGWIIKDIPEHKLEERVDELFSCALFAVMTLALIVGLGKRSVRR